MSVLFKPTPRQVEALGTLSGKAKHVMLEGGSRSGKTAILVYALIVRAMKSPGSRHVILRFRFNHCKQSIWMDTLPKILRLALPPEAQPEWNNSDFFVRFANGSEIWIGGLDDKARTEKIFGLEFATIYFNECSQVSFNSVEDAWSRLAQKTTLQARCYYDQNPASVKHWTYTLFHLLLNPSERLAVKPEQYTYLKMNPIHNTDHIAPGYIDDVLRNMSARKRKRFLDGDYAEDVEGALWTSDMIGSTRRTEKPEGMKKVCVGVDPAVTSKATSAETGIITKGLDDTGHLYAWRDDTCRATPAQWARKAVAAYYEEDADAIVCETNQGGDLVEMNIRNCDKNVNVVQVRATHGKYARAEPIAALMESDDEGNYKKARDHIIGQMPDLEGELTGWSPVEDEESPNRLDAYVWASHWLIGTHKHAGTWGTPRAQMPARKKTFARSFR